MDTRIKHGISRLFRASFSSCKSKHLSNDTQDPVFIHHQSLQPSDPFIHRRADADERRGPTTSPDPALDLTAKEEKPKMRKKKKKKKKKMMMMEGKEAMERMLSSSSSADTRGLFSSDGEREEETETLVSSKSFSSDSSELYCRHCRSRPRRIAKSRRRKVHARNSNMGFEALDSVSRNTVMGTGKVRDSVAVVKRSNDPYGDFRRSMMEMIIEKQMFTVKDLQQLLHCFLSLNSVHHHQIIVEAFMEIWDALFANRL